MSEDKRFELWQRENGKIFFIDRCRHESENGYKSEDFDDLEGLIKEVVSIKRKERLNCRLVGYITGL